MSIALILNQQDTTTTSTLLDIATKKDSIVSLSSLVSEQLPSFVASDHPRMVAFLEAYYEWMQQKDETLYSTFVLKDCSDVDDTMTAFVEHFKSQYLEGFPKALAYDKTTSSLVDEKRLIKRIKELQISENSIVPKEQKNHINYYLKFYMMQMLIIFIIQKMI